MKKIIEWIKEIPWYGYVFAAGCIGVQCLVYLITGQINAGRAETVQAVSVKIAAIDDAFPFIVNSIIFYFASFIFWFLGAIEVSKCGKEHVVNLSIGYFICLMIGLMFFVFMPTYIDRQAEGVLDAVKQPGFTNWLLNLIYQNDGGRYGVNLFPSFHCFVTMWWCLAAHFQKRMRPGYKMFTVIAVILVCVSTLTTKQHYFLDIVGGLGLAVVIFFPIKWINPAKYIFKKKVSE
ncbi:MAG: phosphatase PAP2 family protein [Firmicutes bacterium]|nr:phosphatase PAP2 family protein [Candidatus Fiminaster equi]